MMSCLKFTSYNGLYDDFSNIVTNHVSSQPFAIFGVKYHLYKTFRVAGCRSFTRCTKWKFTHLYLITCIFGLLLRKANRCYFRTAISASRHIIIVDWLWLMIVFLLRIGDIFNADDAFFAGHMGQSLSRYTITDSIETGNVCLVKLVDHNFTLFCFDTVFFQTNTFNVCCYADGT